ncbi:MAG: DUF1365 domain-containing protein [Pirellulaceae bacterium]|nr:DUF1365 domain-containing protein [Pirellulaceae bacterium]
MHSCIYDGFVRHRRFQPIRRDFQYRITYLYLDLAELDQVFERLSLLGNGRFSLTSIYRPDHLGSHESSLDDAVRNLVAERTNVRPTGAIRMMTQWRTFGFYFSPINLFFCFDESETLETVVAEVSNTPWREQHSYVLWSGNQAGRQALAYRHPKDFHVSPFLEMGLEYDWRMAVPNEQFSVDLKTLRDSKCLFDASMQVNRRELSNRNWLKTLVRYPVPAARILTAIYYEALRIWLRKCPYYPHPKTKDPSDRLPNENLDKAATKAG